MKKLYRKGAVHPSPPQNPDHLLSFLPATILTLTVALTPEDKQVLAYLISCSSSSNFSGNRKKNTTATSSSSAANNNISTGVDHPPSFNCYCFRCYMSFWVRWDSSPNRQLLHEIIDAYEDGLSIQSKKDKSCRKEKKKKSINKVGSGELTLTRTPPPRNEELAESSSSSSSSSSSEIFTTTKVVADDDDGGEEEEEEEEEEMGKSSLRRFVSFVGEKIWGVWT
ncbi:hypothetical protein ACH5RR_017542 [Cinchona calisaya]|uniref:Uncharacterized protein n=1 Tax=Cinchona calisaya TaxID=153742 RepID=A0ABD2ZNT1_9GENT